MSDHFYVYILTNKSRTLYIGYTNDLYERVIEHKQKKGSAFTARYNINKLLYWETYGRDRDALDREKQLKGWTRAKKTDLIKMMNPTRSDLSEGWENRKAFDGAFISSHHRIHRSQIEGRTIAERLLSGGGR